MSFRCARFAGSMRKWRRAVRPQQQLSRPLALSLPSSRVDSAFVVRRFHQIWCLHVTPACARLLSAWGSGGA
eukprot:11083658-Alexandrium_andersonii.AAC.1